MIVLALSCSAGHGFEGWFDSFDAFEDQVARKLLSCPMCGQQEVIRVPAGINLRTSANRDETPASQPEASAPSAESVAALIQALKDMADHSEDVSDRFPEEARKIHYGEAEKRAIRGQASLADTAALLEEGIPVLPVPFPSKKGTH